MGDIADLYDYWDDNMDEEDDIIERIKNKVWATSDGTEIKICEMETQHIGYCVKWIKKNECEGMLDDYLDIFNEELGRRKIVI